MSHTPSNQSISGATLIKKAQDAITNNRPLDALAYFEMAVELEPENELALVGKIRTLLRIGDVEEAVRTCDKLRLAHEKPLVWGLHEVVTTLYNAQNPPRFVNIGGGPFFNFASWLNLESVPSPSNPVPTSLSPQTIIPADTESIEIVFSSHCFEHLDDETVSQCLTEARRVLQKDGVLVVKLPNFDDVLKAWKNGDLQYFSDATWNYGPIKETWGRANVEDTIHSRASMVFCGYWNEAYGDHFAERRNLQGDAYHGPARCDQDVLESLSRETSPHEIAKRLKTIVDETESEAIFSHQNAWSREEFSALLENHGFQVLSLSPDAICKHHSRIPGIETMRDISNFFLATPGRSPNDR